MRKPRVTELSCARTQLTCPLQPADASAAATHALHALLFLRNQLPCLFEDLVNAEEATNSNERRTAATRRKAVAAIEALSESLEEAYSQPGLRSCLFLLGRSAARPREAFELAFAVSNSGLCREGRGCDVGKRVVRSLLEAFGAQPVAARGLKLYTLLQFDASAQSTVTPPDGFLLRRMLRPRFDKARLLCCVSAEPKHGGCRAGVIEQALCAAARNDGRRRGAHGAASSGGADAAASHAMERPSVCWYVSRRPLRAIMSA